MGARTSKPWTADESEALFRNIFQERKTNRLPNRSTIECEQHLQAFLTFHRPTIPAAITAYHKRNPESAIKRGMSDKILAFAIEKYKKHYWDLISEIFLLGEEKLQEGIRKRVKEFHETLVRHPYIDIPLNSEFHL